MHIVCSRDYAGRHQQTEQNWSNDRTCQIKANFPVLCNLYLKRAFFENILLDCLCFVLSWVFLVFSNGKFSLVVDEFVNKLLCSVQFSSQEIIATI